MTRVVCGRPVVASITWFTGGSHFVAIAGAQDGDLLILDPGAGMSVVRFGAFPPARESPRRPARGASALLTGVDR